MRKHSAHTLRFWEEGAVSFLCDITDQVAIPRVEDDKLKMSKLRRDEAHRMLVDLSGALGLDWGDFLASLAVAWRARRDEKALRLGWFSADDDDPAWRPRHRPQRRVVVVKSGGSAREQWIQLCLF